MATRSLTPGELSFTPALADFPTVVEAASESAGSRLLEVLEEHREPLLHILAERGALLFRGFSTATSTDFEAAARALGLHPATNFDFGLTRRSQIEGRVFTSTDHDARLMIPPHTEMSYSNERPSWIAFYCHRPPDRYGETPIFDMAGVYRDLPGPLQQAFLRRPVEYVRRVPAKADRLRMRRTIKDTFGAEDPGRIQALADRLDIGIRWIRPDLLETRTSVDAVVRHPRTGDLCWNAMVVEASAYAFMYERFADRHAPVERAVSRALTRLATLFERRGYQTFLLDDRRLSRHELSSLYDSFFRNCTVFTWRTGDVLFLDNIRIGHGRLAFAGERDIRSCFGDFYDVRHLSAA